MKKENNIRYDILQTAGMTIPGKFLIVNYPRPKGHGLVTAQSY